MLLSKLYRGIYATLFSNPISLSSITSHQITCIGNPLETEKALSIQLFFFFLFLHQKSSLCNVAGGLHRNGRGETFAAEDATLLTQCMQENEFYFLNPDNNFCGLKPGTICSAL